MNKVYFCSIVTLLMLILLLVAGCSQQIATSPGIAKTTSPSVSSSGAPQSGGTLRMIVGRVTNPGYPVEGSMADTAMSCRGICLERPALNDLSGAFAPTGLVTNRELAKDGKSILLNLRKGVKYHDGTDFNATAMKWNLQLYMNAHNSIVRTYTSIDVVDDYSLRINITKYENNILGDLPTMISPTAVQKNGIEWARTHPVGTGPFKCVGFERDVSVKYERFDDYWGGKPYLDGIEILIIPDEMVQSATMQKREADILYNASAKISSELKAKGFQLIGLDWNILTLIPDSANPNSIFANKKVREAMEYAIDREAITKAMGYGQNKPAYQVCTPSFVGYVPDLKPRLFNPDIAKQLLTEAGYPKGFQTQVFFQSGIGFQDEMTSVQRYLQQVGIIAEVNYTESAKWIQLGQQGWQNGLKSQRIPLSVTMGSVLSGFFGPESTWTRSMYRSPEFSQTVTDALTVVNNDEIKTKSQKVIRSVYDESLALPILSMVSPFVVAPNVHDSNFWYIAQQFDWTPGKTWLSK
jgi:peptide/nickel transport system substrate-binding protein